MKKLLIAIALSSVFTLGAQACTTVLVGDKASVDGSRLIARSADSSALKAQHMVMHPATHGVKGMYRTADHNGANNFEYPLPENGLAYSTVPNWKTQLHGAVGFNSLGVGISGTESIFARDDFLVVDPYVEDKGITEDDIPDVILPRMHSAREGVQLLGKIVEEIGAGEGFGVAFVDEHELWYFETGTGHQWLAQRIPEDVYFSTGNQGRLQKYIKGNSDYMASPDLVEFAIKHGFYDPKKDGEFNFSKAYCRDDDRDRVYNDPRVCEIQAQFNPSTKQIMYNGRDFPVFMKPEQKLSVADLKAMLRNHYEGKDFDPYTNGLKGDSKIRPISVFRTYESHVMQVRPWLPKEIGEVTYLAFGMADLSVYLPYYQGLDAYPAHYGVGTDKADNVSAYWKYRKLQTLVMTDYPKLAPIVKKAYGEFETQLAERQKAFEAEYLKVAKADPKKAKKMIHDWSYKVIADAEALTDKLTNEMFTIRTEDIQKANFFANNKHKD